MPGPAMSKHFREQRRKGFLKVVEKHKRKKGRLGGFPKGYKAPYKGKDPRRGTVE